MAALYSAIGFFSVGCHLACINIPLIDYLRKVPFHLLFITDTLTLVVVQFQFTVS